MPKKILLLISLFLLFFINVYSDTQDYGFRPMRNKIRYKEEFYQLGATWLYNDLDSESRTIFFYELATVVPFDDPIKALVPITNEIQYARYTNLVMMDLYRLLTQSYIDYGNMYMKEHIYFLNKEYFTNYLEGYVIAEQYFKWARAYWELAIEFAKKADKIKGWRLDGEYNGLHIAFENTMYRIKVGNLNYYKVLDSRLRTIEKNRSEIASHMSKP